MTNDIVTVVTVVAVTAPISSPGEEPIDQRFCRCLNSPDSATVNTYPLKLQGNHCRGTALPLFLPSSLFLLLLLSPTAIFISTTILRRLEALVATHLTGYLEFFVQDEIIELEGRVTLWYACCSFVSSSF